MEALLAEIACEAESAAVPSDLPPSADAAGAPLSAPARLFLSCKDNPDPEVRTNFSLVDVADDVLKAQHSVAEAHRPNVESLHRGLPATHRRETIQWIVQAFQVMRFPDCFIFDTAQLLDRFYSIVPVQERAQMAQKRLLGMVCTALKTGPMLDTRYSLSQLISHLGRDQVAFSEVLRAELDTLQHLRFIIGTPTAYDFTEGAWERVCGLGEWSSATSSARGLAHFLLQLALTDASFYYQYSSAVLATACIRVALLRERAPEELQEALLEDLELQVSKDPSQELQACSEALRQLWQHSFAAPGPYFACLQKKFADRGDHAAQRAPASLLPRFHTCTGYSPGAASDASLGASSNASTAASLSAGRDEPGLSGCAVTVEGRRLAPEREPMDSAVPCSDPWGSSALDWRQTPKISDMDEAIAIVLQSLALAPESGPKDVSQPWVSQLGTRSQHLLETSYKVRAIWSRFGWNRQRMGFQRCPDRNEMLRALREARGELGAPQVLENSRPAPRAVRELTERILPSRRHRSSSWSGSFKPHARTQVTSVKFTQC